MEPTPKAAPSFSEAEAALERAGRVEDLLKLYDSRSHEVASNEAAALLTKAGEIARDRLKNVQRAEEYLRRALLLSADPVSPLRALRGLYEQRQDFGALAETLEKLAAASTGAESAALSLRAADLFEHRLNRKDRAVIAAQRAIRADPKQREAYRLVRRMFLADGRFISALDSLDRERLALGPDGLADEYGAIAVQLLDDPSQYALAQRAADVALNLSPEQPDALVAKKAVENIDQTWRDRVRTLRSQSLEERDRKKAARLSLVVARLFAFFEESATGKIKEALDRCFLLWPGMPEALQLIEQMAQRKNQPKMALDLFLQQISQVRDRHAQVDLWLRVGLIRLSTQQDQEGALKAFEAAANADPSRADACTLAAELMLESDRANDAVAILEKHLATLKDRWAQVSLRMRLADLCAGRVDQPEKAREHLEAVLKAEPYNAEAAFRLARLAAESEDRESLMPHFSLATWARRPLAERVALCESVAMLCEEQEDAKGAFQALARALELSPNRPGAIESVLELAEKANALSDAAAALKRAALSENDAEPAAKLWKAAAKLYADKLAEPDAAEVAWSEVLKRLPEDSEALSAVDALKKAAAVPLDERGKLEAEAKKLETRGGQAEELAKIYEQLLALNPHDPSVLKRLGATYASLSRWEEVAKVATALAQHSQTQEEQLEWTARLAQLYADRLGRKDDAAKLYLQHLKDAGPTQATLKALEKLQSAGVQSQEISRALAAHYESGGDAQGLVAALLVQLSATSEPVEQKRLLLQLASVHEQKLADRRAAFSFMLRAVAIEPADEVIREFALKTARELSAQNELSRLLVELANKQAEAQTKLALLLAAADIAEEAQASDEAAEALSRAMELAPEDAAVIDRLLALEKKAGNLAEVEALLERRIALVEGDAVVALQLELARVKLELNRPAFAAAVLEAALKSGADEATVLPLLANAWERAGRMGELADVLQRQIAAATKAGDKDGAARLSLKRAKILEASVGDRAEAVKNYSNILKERPSDPDALAALEHLLGDPQCREEAARALVPAYESTKDHRKLVEALKVVGESAKDSLERVLALKQAASVYATHLRQPDLAFATLASAMRVDPADAVIRTATRQAAEDADAVDSFAEVLAELVDEAPSNSKPVIHRELADVFEKKLADRDEAIAHLRSALKLEPSNQEALKTLVRLHRAGEEWAALAEMLEKLAAVIPETAEKISLWREVAQLHETRLSDPESAASAWRNIAEADPLDRQAATALDRLYEQLNRARDLAFALELRRNQEGQSPQGREICFRLASLKKEELEDASAALQLFAQILSEDPGHAATRAELEQWAQAEDPQSGAALEILDPALAQSNDHARRVAIREARLSHATTTAEKSKLTAEIRAIYERDMQQPDRAFMATLKAFSENLDREALKPELERLAKLTGSFEELADIYEAAASELTPGDEQLLPLIRRAAELREQLQENDEAIRLWKELLAEAPQDRQALDALSALYEKSENAKSLSEVYAKKAQLSQDPQERLDLFLKAGAAFEAAGDDGQATEAFKSALAIEKNVTALEALDRLYGRAQAKEAQGDVLAQLAAMTAEPGQKKQYLARRAALLEKSEEFAEAVPAWVSVLELTPGDAAAIAGLERLFAVERVKVDVAKLLEPVYRSQNDHRKLVDVLEVLVQVAPQGGKRLSVLNEIATLREATGQKAQAFATRLRAFNEDPENAQVRDELERLAAETGSFEELVGAYEDQLERGGSADLELELWRRLASVYGERLDDPQAAAKAWEQVASRAGSDPSVLEQLARIHRKTNNFRALAEVMRRQVRIEPDVASKVNLLFELAHLAEESLSDKALSAQCYQDILSVKPGDANAIKLLGRVLQETERYPELAELIATEIQLAEQNGAKEEAFELMIRLGRLKFNRLGDARGAITLYQSVLAKRPGHPGAVGAIEELARSDSPLRGEAAEILEPIFNTGGDHLKLIQMLESRASAETVPAERAALLRKVAHIYAGPMENAASAFIAATKALRELPDDEAALHLCIQYVDAAEAQDELAMLLEEVSERASDDKARANLYKALARLKQQAGEADEALDTWKRVIELQPSDSDALDAVSSLYAQSGRSAELLEVLRRQLAMAEEPNRRAALLLQMGSLQEDQLEDALGALATFRRLLELKPNDASALEKMDGLCVKQERWPELADVLARRIQIANESTAPGAAQQLLELKFRLGQVRESRLLDRFGALDLYTEILNTQPNHAGAVGRLEAICQKEPQNQLAVEVLLRAYRSSGEIGKLAMLIDARVAVSSDPFERKTLLLELARLRDGQDEPELGYLALYRAFKEDPNDPDLRRKLEGAADAAKAYDELASAYEEELPRIAEASDAAEICLKLGATLDQRLDEPDRAVIFYEKARQLDPAVWSRALPALDRLYNKLGKGTELASVLEALAALTQDPTEKVGLLFRLGQLAQEQLDSPDRAAVAYEKILEIERKHIAAARLLEGIYEQAGAQSKLYGVLKLQQELVSGPERERVMGKMAQISAESLDDVEHSIEIYRELLQKNPRNDNAFNALEQLLEKGKKYDELQQLIATKISQTLDPRELVRLNDRLGRVLYKLQNKPEEAIPYFKAALERDARHRTALEHLRDIYEQLGKKDDLVIVLRRLIPLQEGPEGVKAQRIRLAEVLAEMGRREEALDSARRALEVEPHQPAELNRIHNVFLTLKAMADAVRALEARADAELKAEDTETAVDTLFEVAEFWRTIAQKPENAGPVLMRILELDPANRTAYEQATTLFSKVNDWRSYAIVLEKYLPNLVTDEEKLNALRDLAKTQETKLGQKNLAFMAWCRALQLNPAADGVTREVERLAEETGSFDELAAVYEEVADEVPRGPLAEQLYLTLSRVQDEKMDDPPAAEASLRKVLEFDPTNLKALDQLASMFSRRGRNKEYIVALEQKLEAAGSIEARKHILVEIAKVFDERLSDQQEAATALLRALELEPDRETLQLLVNLYRRQGQFQHVASTLLRARDLAPTPEERASLQVEIASVYERELNDDESAVQGYAQALEFDPSNPQALASLENLYTKLDRPAELLEVYQRQLELTPDYRERVKILFKCAAIWEDKYQNLANADAYIEGVLAVDPQNLQAIKTLERLRRAQQRYEELVQVMERHIQLVTHPAEQAELLVEMGDVYHQQLHLVDRAVATYHQALELNPKSRPAMHALGTLYERSGNWPFALDMLAREAQAAGSTPEAVELYYRMGKINEDMLLDPGSAKSCYEQALHIDPSYLPCIRALKGIHEIEKDWGSYEKTLIQEAQQTEDPEAKARAMLEVAKYYAETREDRDAALPWYEDAIRLVPDLVEAARPLADIYIAWEKWDRGEKMMDIVVRKMAEKAVAEQDEQLARELCRQLYRLGYVTEKLGNKVKALGAYEKAYGLDATYLPALEGLGNLLVQAKRYEEALKVLQTILIHHREELTDLEVVEIYWSIGDVNLAIKQFDKAQNHFEKALSIDQGHEPSLRSLVAIADLNQRWEKSAEYRQNLSQVLDGDEKYKTLVELGKIARDRLSDAYMAIDAYSTALKLKEDALDVMDALYVLFRETRQGQKAAEVLEKMLSTNELRADGSKLKRVWFALGEICRDELKEYDRAAMAFNAALDTDFRFIEAFSALEAMLGQTRQWKLLEENYARMIQRLPKGDETHAARMTLWKALGDLYLNVLKHPDGALMAYQVVSTGLPDNAEIQLTFAELAAQKPGEEEKAVAAYRRALPNTDKPGKVASALAEIAAKRKDYDSAWLAAQVSSGLIGEPGAGEKEILTKLTPYAKKKEVAQKALSDRLWQSHLFHPKLRGPISELMAILFEQAGQHYAVAHDRYGINPRKHRIDVATAQEYQIHHYRYVAKVLGMEGVELFSPFLIATRERLAKRSNEPAPEPTVNVDIVHSHPVGLKVGGKFFSESGQKEVYYVLGRQLALLRPELALSQRLSAERIEAVFQAAISLSTPNFRFTADPNALAQERKLLEKALPEPARAALARVMREYLRTATPNDIKNYLEGAELTAVRAGLFVAGEIDPVKKMVLSESGAAYRVPSRSKIRDLMVFALSEDLHALRVAVGTHVEIVRK